VRLSNVGNANVSGAFVTMGTPTSTADTYLEISFTGAAGSLDAGEPLMFRQDLPIGLE
jgi:hypothetical protein